MPKSLACFIIILTIGCLHSQATSLEKNALTVADSCIYERTVNGTEDYVVPAGVTELTFEAVGADGGRVNASGGGTGGTVTATFAVTPGDVIRFIVGEAGHRINNGGSSGGGATAIINCGNSGVNCDDGNGTILIVAGGGGGAGHLIGNGATIAPGNGSGGLEGQTNVFPSGGGGGINGMGGGDNEGGAQASQNPTFSSRTAEGFAAGGLGAGIGGNGGGGGGYTGGNGTQTTGGGGDGGTNFVASTAINIINTGGVDGAAFTFNDGSICIVEQVSAIDVSIMLDPINCGEDDLTFTAVASGASHYDFFDDADQDGEVDPGESLQSGANNVFMSNLFMEGDVISVLVNDGVDTGFTSLVIPPLFPFSSGTPGVEDYTVPAGVTEIIVEATGGGGGFINSSGIIGGGTGGSITATLPAGLFSACYLIYNHFQ